MGRGLRPRVRPGPARLLRGAPSQNRPSGESKNRMGIAQAVRIHGQRSAKSLREQSLQVLKEPLRPSPQAGLKALGRLCGYGFAAAFRKARESRPRRTAAPFLRILARNGKEDRQGLLDALEPRRPKTPAPDRPCPSAGGGRGLAKPTPGAERAARRRNYPNLFDILLQEFWVRAEPHENIMRSIDVSVKGANTRSALRRQIAKLGRNGRVLTNLRSNYSIITLF